MVTDSFGGVAKIVRSTISSDPAIWLMVKHGEHSKYKGALHLNKEQARALVLELETFINAH